jgi:multidrug efflux system membrane fusion protein
MSRFVRDHAGTLQLIFVVAVVASALLLSSSLRPDAPRRAPAAGSAALAVSVVRPDPGPFRPMVRLNGVVQARTVTSIVPQVSGRVVEVAAGFRPGASVSKGEMLFVIDPSDYELAVERTLAEIEVARSDLTRLEAEAAAEREIWRGQFPNRPIPDLIARVPQIAAVKARLRSAEAARRSAELALSRTRVRAPFDARILETRLDVGQVVGTTAEVGTMFSLDSLEVAVSVSADERRLIGPVTGQAVTIIAAAADEEPIEGRLVRAAAALDERTRLGTLYVSTADNEWLTVGEFVTVEIEGVNAPDAYRIPAAALTSRDRVWVLEGDRLAARTVEVVGREGDMAVVTIFDVANGVVSIPPADAREGMLAVVREPGELTAADTIRD